MLNKLNYSFSKENITQVLDSDIINDLLVHNTSKSKFAINKPTGRFFYDQWVIKDEFKGTVIEKLMESLPLPVGEARFVILKPGSCYHSHADIDDRYHLNIQGQYSYLIDLDTETMFETVPNSMWYTMDTSRRHVAANFGSIPRIQLVARHLLRPNVLNNPIRICLRYTKKDNAKVRFVFDDKISPWLNRACKRGVLANFDTDFNEVRMDLEETSVCELSKILPEGFEINTI